MPVAKWSCQNSASFSWTAAFVVRRYLSSVPCCFDCVLPPGLNVFGL
jgi:hypothetical protein